MGNNSHFKPIRSTDDPRYKKLEAGRTKYNARRSEHKQRKKQYQENLAQFKANQLQVAQDAIESGDVLTPAEMLLELIAEQRLAMSNPDLNVNEQNKERDLYLKMYKEYAALTGANAPTSQSVDVTGSDDQEMSKQELEQALDKYFENIEVIDDTSTKED